MTSSRLTRDRLIMLPLMIGISLSPLNVVLTGVALPTMRDAFAVDIQQATWIGTAYLIPSVAFMPLQGYLGQRWGMRRVYAAGMLVLAMGALMSGLTRSFNGLLFGRALQGVGWAALYPLALVLIRSSFVADMQGSMMGLWESAVGLTTVIAPLIGGALVQFYGWSALYFVLAFVAALGFILTLWLIPAQSRDVVLPTDLDWWGAVQVTAVFMLLLLSITRTNGVLFGIAMFVGLFWQQRARRQTRPFVSPSIFTNRRFMMASLAANLRMLTAVAALTALPLFFEDVNDLKPAAVGSLLVIYSLFLLIASWPGGRWSDHSGPRRPGGVGYVAMIAGLLLLLRFDAKFSLWIVALAFVLRGIGAGLSQAPFAQAAVGAVAQSQSQVAAGLYGTIRYSGLALGTALVGVFLQARLVHHRALSGGAAALPAYQELWWLLALIACIGLLATWLMGSTQPAPVLIADK